jgi:hypothetical protein
MANRAFFAGLIFDELERPLDIAFVGGDACYVLDDDGFRRHLDAEMIDRQILQLLLEQLHEHKDIAVAQALSMIGQDDLFTKAAVDASIRNATPDDALRQGLPPQARDMLAMMGVRMVVNWHGELVRIDQPGISADDEE